MSLLRSKDEKHPIHIVAGPTASGKSARAMELASALDGVIINCDSQQIYDGMPVLCAQPPAEDLESVPHLLYAHLHPNEVCSAGNYRELAEPVIEEVLAQGKVPVICGGTGLYIRALVEGLSPMPDIPEEVRKAVVARYEQEGAEAFYADLQARDPVMAERFHVNHKARIIRAMEVLEATGQSLAEWQKLEREAPPAHWDFHIEVVMPDREVLYQRCNERFLWMLGNGAWEEVEEFAGRVESGEVKDGVPLTKALGYKPLLACLRGELDKDEAIRLGQTETRHYAKRQSTWFRNQLNK